MHGAEAAAVSQVASLTAMPTDLLRATGTESAMTKTCYRIATSEDAEPCLDDAAWCDEGGKVEGGVIVRKGMKNKPQSDVLPLGARGDKNRTGRIRTCNQGIMSPLL